MQLLKSLADRHLSRLPDMQMARLYALIGVVFYVACAHAEVKETAAAEQASFKASDYVYNPVQANKLVTSAGGSSTPRMLEQWPTLSGLGIAQTFFVMNGCAVRPVHTHMRATGLLFAFQAANLSVGFITEGGQLVQNYIQSGASTVFPVGLLHYQQNLDCNPAYYTISYNNEDPGTQVTIPAYNKFPASVAASNLGLDTANYQNVLKSQPQPAFIPNSDPDCVARCQAAGVNVLAPASALMPPTTSAGR